MKMISLCCLPGILWMVGTAPAFADEVAASDGKDIKVHVVKKVRDAPAPQPFFIGHPGMMLPPETAGFAVGFGAHVDGKVVKNKPYSASAITEQVRVLSDGNRIVNAQRARQYRDAAGRTRHEQLATHGAEEGQPVSIRISDPVSKESWLLIPHGRMAIRLPRLEMVAVDGEAPPADVFSAAVPAPEGAVNAPHVMVASVAHVVAGAPPPELAGLMPAPGMPAEQAEKADLGQQVVEGLEARGERITHTLPANAIGNEQPVIRTTETWRADSIESVVLMTVDDPLQGNVRYSLTDISQADVPADLFVVPDDYQKVEEPAAFAPLEHR